MAQVMTSILEEEGNRSGPLCPYSCSSELCSLTDFLVRPILTAEFRCGLVKAPQTALLVQKEPATSILDAFS